jgi:hypothetical protein
MTTPIRRGLPRDIAAIIALPLMAITVYGAMFLHAPVLTEVRDFLLRFGHDAELRDMFIPSGNDYRPFSWKFFDWQQQLFGFNTEVINLVQFILLGLCAVVAYIHLRQLLGHRAAAFGGSVLWLFSLPVAHSALWQATQHDKLAFLFVMISLIVTLHAIRAASGSGTRAGIVIPLTLIVSAVAVATKPIAFILPIALAAQVLLFTPGKKWSHYLRNVWLIVIPATYVGLYAVLYMFATTAEWRAHTMSGNKIENVLFYIRNLTNIDYDGSLSLALLWFAPVIAVWFYALRTIANPASKVAVYLLVIFIASIAVLAGAAHATSFYLLLPLFAFTGSLAAGAVLMAGSSNFRIRRCTALVVIGVCGGLFCTYLPAVAGHTRLATWGRNARNLADGYAIMRARIDPACLQSISFSHRVDPDSYFYFFSDGTHQTIDPTIPSFIFGRQLNVPISDSPEGSSSDAADGGLVAVWTGDLRLTELRFSGEIIYQRSALASEPLTYVPGTTINFQKGGDAKRYQGSGWSHEEDWGTWTEGPEATLSLRLDEPHASPMEMVVRGQAFLSKPDPGTSVQVVTNGVPAATWTFNQGDSLTDLRAQIPPEVAPSPLLQISFRILNPRSPQSMGISGDTRALGLLVQSLRIYFAQQTGLRS